MHVAHTQTHTVCVCVCHSADAKSAASPLVRSVPSSRFLNILAGSSVTTAMKIFYGCGEGGVVGVS